LPPQLTPAAPIPPVPQRSLPLPSTIPPSADSLDLATHAEIPGDVEEEAPECPLDGDVAAIPEVDEILRETGVPAPKAAVLEPIDGTGESFEVWESGSAKDEAEAGAAAAALA